MTSNDKKTIIFLAPIGLLMGYMFAIGRNAFIFQETAVYISLFIVILFSALLLGMNVFFAKIFSNIFQGKTFSILFCLFFACEIVFCTWCSIYYGEIPYKLKLWAPVLTVVVFFLLYTQKSRVLLVFLLIMTTFSTINFLRNNFSNPQIPSLNTPEGNIHFHKKPNIFLFWLESYHSFDILKSMYDIHNSDFQNFLKNNNFVYLENTYSNGGFTLDSFAQLYSCRNLPSNILLKGNLDVARSVRNLLGGDENNFVLKILKDNGYRTTVLVDGSYYYFFNKGIYLDDTDLAEENILLYIWPLIATTHWQIMDQPTDYAPPYGGSLVNRVKIAVERSKKTDQPFFLAFKGGARHTPPNGYSWEERNDWIKGGFYQNCIKTSDKEATEIIEYIIKEDPNSIIILLGDHGSWTYRNFPENGSGEPFKSSQKYNVNLQDIFDDRFKVLFAYRLPQGQPVDIAAGLYMNNSNIFLHIFSWLANDPKVLNLRPPVECRIGEAKMSEGGKIFSSRQPL